MQRKRTIAALFAMLICGLGVPFVAIAGDETGGSSEGVSSGGGDGGAAGDSAEGTTSGGGDGGAAGRSSGGGYNGGGGGDGGGPGKVEAAPDETPK